MDVKGLFTKYGVENAELLADIEQAASKLQGIPAGRFRVVVGERNEARTKLAEQEVMIEGLNKTITAFDGERATLGEFKTKYEGIQAEAFRADKESWGEKAKMFNVEEGNVLFEKVSKIKDRFLTPTDRELTHDEVRQNLNNFKVYEDINYFGKQETTATPPNTQKPGGDLPNEKGDFYGYKNIAELARADWRKAEQWKQERK